MPKEVVKEEEISLPKVRKILEMRQEMGELSHVQKVTLDHVAKLSRLSEEKADALVEQLTSKASLPRSLAVQVVNIMPKTVDELRTILAGQSKVYLPSEMEKILSILDEFREDQLQ
mgnify:CR=1 FL=1